MIHITHHMDESRGEEGETEYDQRGRRRETDNWGTGRCFLGGGGRERAEEEGRDGGWEIEELLLGCHLQSKIPYDISSEVATEVERSFIWLTLRYGYSQCVQSLLHHLPEPLAAAGTNTFPSLSTDQKHDCGARGWGGMQEPDTI